MRPNICPATSTGKWAWVMITFPVSLSQELSRNALFCLFSLVYIPPDLCFGFHATLDCSCWSKLESPALWHPECCWGQPAWAMSCLQGQAVCPKSRLWDVKSSYDSTRYLLTVLRSCMRLSGEKKGIKPLTFPDFSQQCMQYTSFNLFLSNGHGCILSAQAARIRNICLGTLMTGSLSLVVFWWSFCYAFIIFFLQKREQEPGSTPAGTIAQDHIQLNESHTPGLWCVCNGWNNFPHIAAEKNMQKGRTEMQGINRGVWNMVW